MKKLLLAVGIMASMVTAMALPDGWPIRAWSAVMALTAWLTVRPLWRKK